MKRLFEIFIFLAALESTNAATVAGWTFETSRPTGLVSANNSLTNIAAEVGQGTASALHSSHTFYGEPCGNGSQYCLGTSNSWSVGDYYQFVVSSTGDQNFTISFDQTGNETGPSKYFLEYSTDGNNFTKFGTDYALSVGDWNATTRNTASEFSFDLSSIASINGQSTLYFRVVDDSTIAIGGGATGFGGDDRIDNVLITAQPAPEPSSLSLAALALTSVFCYRRLPKV